MNPVQFPECNTIFAKDQPEYLPLHCHRSSDGTVVTCWKLSWWERLTLLFSGKFYLTVLTFNHPLQPLKPSVGSPFDGIERDLSINQLGNESPSKIHYEKATKSTTNKHITIQPSDSF